MRQNVKPSLTESAIRSTIESGVVIKHVNNIFDLGFFENALEKSFSTRYGIGSLLTILSMI